jgi:hypothetical protein
VTLEIEVAEVDLQLAYATVRREASVGHHRVLLSAAPGREAATTTRAIWRAVCGIVRADERGADVARHGSGSAGAARVLFGT